MNMTGWKFAWPVVATATACLAFTLSLSAQVETKIYDSERATYRRHQGRTW